MATLTAKNLAKAYKGRRVVEDVSLTVNSGEIVGLLGPNGAGKTTTFYMVVGIVPRDAGNIIIDDEDISLLPLHARAGHRLSAAGSLHFPSPERLRQPDGGPADP
jgi:lipopolysaccharide export system ATP-binding protein